MPLGQHNVKGAPTAWAVDRSDIDGCQSNHHTKTLKEFYSTFTLSHGCGDEAAERQVPRSSPSGSNHNVAGGTSTKVFTAFIGVGSNLGDRIGMIEQACNEMEKRGIRVVRTSSLWETQAMYVVDQDAFVNGVCEVNTDLPPAELLDQLQDIERTMGRRKVVDKGPRNIDLDILLYRDLQYDSPRLSIPHKLMLEREFVLRPLCQLIPSTIIPIEPSKTVASLLQALPTHDPRMSTLTPYSTSQPPFTPLLSDRHTRVMLILNVTPDSFSDGGLHSNNDADADAVASMILSNVEASGATIVDVGGQSTRPGAEDVGESKELARILPVIHAIRRHSAGKDICISIDTYRASVAAEAISAGADMINDISAGTLDAAMLPTAASLGATICLMHTRGTPATMTSLTSYPAGVVKTVGAELLDRVHAAEAAGIRRWRIVLDPGIGFAKTQAQNLELLRDFASLRATPGLEGLPWLVGSSRKGFVGRVTGVKAPRERTWGTATTVSAAIAGGADLVRVHDAVMAQVVKMADAIWRG